MSTPNQRSSTRRPLDRPFVGRLREMGELQTALDDGLPFNATAGRFADAQEAFDRAVAIAVREGDSALEMRTLANNANIVGNQTELG